jgi:hypothetical protein
LQKAADDLAATRRTEAEAVEAESKRLLTEALDEQPAQQPQPESIEPQPEAVPEAPTGRETWHPVDQKIGQFLESDPAIAERIQSSYAQVVQQSQAHVDQVRQVYAAATNQLAQEINIVTAALIPEIVGMSPEEARGTMAVIAKNDPARAQQIANFANRVQGAVNLTQQHQHQQQQAQQQQAEFQQRQAAEAFQKYAAAEDAKALAKETPESLTKIRNLLYEDGKKAGYSKADIDQAWGSVPALRNAFVSELIADGAKWRMAQRSLRDNAVRKVPTVQRPGASTDARQDHGDVAVASSRFNLPGGNVGTQGLRNAAALVMARRRG